MTDPVASVMIPGWAWAVFLTLVGVGLTFIGAVLRAYTSGVDTRLTDHDKQLGKQRERITKVETEVSALKVR
ncbi:MAG TPA: hypothetical protein VN033_10260 [Vulgatibacter sp.]|nr:hypothetical protein [Vulgatibacter sp.]